MSESPLEPLPPEIAALLALEKGAYDEASADLKAGVFRHVEAAVELAVLGGAGIAGGSGGASTAAATGAAAGAKKIVGVVLAALAVGGGVGATTTAAVYEARRPGPPPPSLETRPPGAPRGQPPSLPDVFPPAASDASSREPTASSAAASASLPLPRPIKKSPEGDLARERELLDFARAALARGRADDAIAAAEQHARKWPRGYLDEERDVILVQALAAAGRRTEAEARAARFRRDHPRSMLLPALNAALEAAAP